MKIQRSGSFLRLKGPLPRQVTDFWKIWWIDCCLEKYIWLGFIIRIYKSGTWNYQVMQRLTSGPFQTTSLKPLFLSIYMGGGCQNLSLRISHFPRVPMPFFPTVKHSSLNCSCGCYKAMVKGGLLETIKTEEISQNQHRSRENSIGPLYQKPAIEFITTILLCQVFFSNGTANQ